jgi:hypothetical protein
MAAARRLQGLSSHFASAHTSLTRSSAAAADSDALAIKGGTVRPPRGATARRRPPRAASVKADWLQLARFALTPRAACSQPAIGEVSDTLFKWPIITQEDEDAVIDVLRNESLSGTNITREFEVGSQMHQRPLLPAIARLTPRLLCLYGQVEFAEWIGLDHALAYPNGTMAILGTPSSRPHPHPHPGCPHPTRLSACWTYLPTELVLLVTALADSHLDAFVAQRRSMLLACGAGTRSSVPL